jgi:hypothetical protein
LCITVLPLIIALVIMLNYEHAVMQSQPLALQANPDPTATTAPAVTIPITASGKWLVETVTTASEGFLYVSLALDADDINDLFSENSLRPRLFLKCDLGQLDAGVAIGSSMPAASELHTVQLIFDALPPETIEMRAGDDSESLVFANPADTIQTIADHEALVMAYSTANSDTVEATFDIRGLVDMVDQLWNACPDAVQGNLETPNAVVSSNPRDTSINAEDGIELGNVVMAEAVDRYGCPTDTATTFDANVTRIYVVAEDSDVVEGTEVFVRWYLDGQVYEDAAPIVADQDYENTCIAFTLEQDDTNQFRTGDYEAEFIINGNAADKVSFEIR